MILNVLIIRHSTMLGYFGYFFIMFGYIGYFSPMSGYFGYFFIMFGYFGYFFCLVWVFWIFSHHVWIFPAKESDPLLISETPVRGRKEAIVQFNLCTMLMMFSGLLSKQHLLFAGSIITKMFAFWELTLHSMRTYFCCDKKND